MKFIRVSSDDDDYGAEVFEQSSYNTKEGIKKLWEDAYNSPINFIVTDDEHNPVRVQVEALSFKEVDPDFVDYIKNEMFDYDLMKDDNIYAVEE
jgi:hypothetical protein